MYSTDSPRRGMGTRDIVALHASRLGLDDPCRCLVCDSYWPIIEMLVERYGPARAEFIIEAVIA